MEFLMKSLLVLTSLCCHATVESFANSKNSSFRLHTGLMFKSHPDPSVIMESMTIPNVEVDVRNVYGNSADDKEKYPIFSLPRKKSFKSKRKELMENARSLVVFTTFLLKSTFVQPAHAVSRNNITTRTQIESKSLTQDEQVSNKRKVVPVSVGVATALGVTSLMKKGKKGDKTAEDETLKTMLNDSPVLKDGMSDPLTSKAKELIRKANQIEEDVSAQTSILPDENKLTNSVSSKVKEDEESRALAAKRLTERIKEETRKAEEARKKEERDRLQLEEKLAKQVQVEVEEEAAEAVVMEEAAIGTKDLLANDAHNLKSESNPEDLKSETATMEKEQNIKVGGHEFEESDDIVQSEQDPKNEDDTAITTKKSEPVSEDSDTAKMEDQQNNKVDEHEFEEGDDIALDESDPNNNDDTEIITNHAAEYDYSAISDPSERAFRLLVNLGMVNEHPDPDSPDYDHSNDDDFAIENKIFLK